MNRLRSVFLLLAAGLPVAVSGCVNPFALGPFTPVPVQPWVADRIQERLGPGKADHQTPVLNPIPPGYQPLCEDPPDRQAMMRAMPRVTRGVPYIYEEFRGDLQFDVVRIVDRIDPPRFYPLAGVCQQHHCHYKCTIYFTETIESSWPFPFQLKRRRVEVVYIDKNHLHPVACTPEALQSMAEDYGGI